MKKILLSILAIFIFMNLFTATATVASEQKQNNQIINYDDGSYLIIEIDNSTTNNIQNRSIITKTSTKTATKYDNKDEVVWVYSLHATFEIEIGRSAVCTSATYSVDIYDDSWKFSDGEAYTLNNIGYGKGKFKLKVLGITIQTVEIDLSLSSDIYSNIS